MFNEPSPDSPAGTRDRLIGAMLEALGTRGFHGVGISELLSRAQAPKGVLYHHFPGGKTEWAVAAIETVVAHITGALDDLFARHDDPVQALALWMQQAQSILQGSGFQRGCPLATIALESTAEDTAIRGAVAKGFAAIRDCLKRALVASGIEAQQAAGLSSLIVSAYEGGLIQARVAGSAGPLQDTATTLLDTLAALMPKGQP
jgi:TetR/AcrR family transcriptional regulator, lmrAB and yxaGH operons repressor